MTLLTIEESKKLDSLVKESRKRLETRLFQLLEEDKITIEEKRLLDIKYGLIDRKDFKLLWDRELSHKRLRQERKKDKERFGLTLYKKYSSDWSTIISWKVLDLKGNIVLQG